MPTKCNHQWFKVRDISEVDGTVSCDNCKNTPLHAHMMPYNYGILVQCVECLKSKELWGEKK